MEDSGGASPKRPPKGGSGQQAAATTDAAPATTAPTTATAAAPTAAAATPPATPPVTPPVTPPSTPPTGATDPTAGGVRTLTADQPPRQRFNFRQVSGTFESSPEDSRSQTPLRFSSKLPSLKEIDSATKTKHPRGILRQSSSRADGLDDAVRAAFMRAATSSLDSGQHRLSPTRQQTLPASPRVVEQTFQTPAVPVKPEELFPPSPPAITPLEAHKIVNALEGRLRRCEQVLGNSTGGLLDQQPQSSDENPTRGSDEFDMPLSTDDSIVADWRKEIKVALQPAPLAVQLRQIKKFTDGVFPGRISEFEKKYNVLQNWLESEHATISQVLLTLHAKRTYILEQERMLRSMAENLKLFDELKQYVDPPRISDHAVLERRLKALEQKGLVIGEKAYKLSEDMQNLAHSHCTAMNVVFGFLGEWSESITKAKEAVEAKRLHFGHKKSVVFAED